MRALRATTALFAAVGCGICVAQNGVSGGAGTSAAEARDMALVGYHDLQARSAYQPLVREQNGRWIAYIGHHVIHLINCCHYMSLHYPGTSLHSTRIAAKKKPRRSKA
jgi:hypothetical protein